MKEERLSCIDAGSEYCPCYLAETNNCITCAHLQGKDFCDCDWKGVCIYQEFYWNGNKKKSTRTVHDAQIIEKKIIDESIILFKIKVTKTLARQLKHPGSYVFIRDPKKPHYFDVPMSIMYADEYKGEIQIAIQAVGPKTKPFLECTDKILIKGPYWNGILGLKDLKVTKEENVLLIARGIALAPAVLAIKYLLKNNNKITFIMDPGIFNDIFIKDYIENTDINKIILNLRTPEGASKLRNMLIENNYDLVYSAGSDELHNMVVNEMRHTEKNMKLVITNNMNICCGEGICGACSCKISSGKIVKMCKTQMDAKEALEGGRKNG